MIVPGDPAWPAITAACWAGQYDRAIIPRGGRRIAVYCLRCGRPLAERLLPTEDRPRLVCDACGYIHYVNPKIVCGPLPVWEGQVWLLRRAIEPRVGYWSHPAGYQEIGE